MIQYFEFTVELAWKTLKEYLENMNFTLNSPREVIKQAFKSGYLDKGDVWLEALNDRNKTANIYDQKETTKIASNIVKKYFPLLKKLLALLKNDSKQR